VNELPSLPPGFRHLKPEDPLPDLPPPPEKPPSVRKPVRPSRPEDEDKPIKVGIVGAGAAGLFTAMIFDYLNSLNLKDDGTGKTFHVNYDILEAADQDRVGGRLFTYNFQAPGPHDYYDVGAMRFPKNPVMKRQEI
jgi:Flavin containing amine oxidoreductase